jgi:hypothetical protein
MLSEDQKTRPVSVCRELKQQDRDDPNFIPMFITGGEIRLYGYDPETKQQSSQWKSPNSTQRVKFAKCQVNVDCFFDIQGIVHKEFVPPGPTVNGKFYVRF